MDCDYRAVAEPLVEDFLATGEVPNCPECDDGGRLKHATVSFGQSLPADVIYAASKWCREADLVFAVGSSLVVDHRPADLPRNRQGTWSDTRDYHA